MRPCSAPAGKRTTSPWPSRVPTRPWATSRATTARWSWARDGKWLITDPGYQQYAKGDEREFTIGPTAHNAPLINGTAQTQKQPRRMVLEEVGPSVRRVAIDLTACYPSAVPLTTLVRHVWLSGKNLVVVADQLEGKQPLQATYHWHGHPACAWWVEANWALLTLDGVQLWFDLPPSPAFRRQPAPAARIARPAVAGLPARKGRTGGLVGLRVGRRAPRAAGGPRRPADPPPGPDVCCVILCHHTTGGTMMSNSRMTRRGMLRGTAGLAAAAMTSRWTAAAPAAAPSPREMIWDCHGHLSGLAGTVEAERGPVADVRRPDGRRAHGGLHGDADDSGPVAGSSCASTTTTCCGPWLVRPIGSSASFS